MSWGIDFWATTVLLRGEKCPKLLKEAIPSINESLTLVDKGRIRAIQSGAIRTGYRLKHGVTKDGRCPKCGQEEEDAKHVFWDCQHEVYLDIRGTFLPTIKKINDAHGLYPIEGEDEWIDLLDYGLFLYCGIIPEDVRLNMYKVNVCRTKQAICTETNEIDTHLNGGKEGTGWCTGMGVPWTRKMGGYLEGDQVFSME